MTDLNKNQIKMNDSGISIESKGDIKLTSSKKIINKASMDFQAEGSNVDFKANAKFSVDSLSTALKSSGIAEVKGSLVKIN